MWNNYQSKVTVERRSRYLDYLIDLSSQDVNRLLVVSFKNNVNRIGHTGYFIATAEIKTIMLTSKK